MQHHKSQKATFAEVIGSIKFSNRTQAANSRPWPATGFAVSKSTHVGEALPDDYKLVRSSN